MVKDYRKIYSASKISISSRDLLVYNHNEVILAACDPKLVGQTRHVKYRLLLSTSHISQDLNGFSALIQTEGVATPYPMEGVGPLFAQ